MPKSERLAPLKIVLVEDDPQVREIISRCLARFGASVTEGDDAFTGLDAVKQVQPDVAIVDLDLLTRDGFGFLGDVRMLGPEHGGNLPVIVMTAEHDPALETTTREAGFANHLTKPFTPIQLLKSVERTLNR
jgi:CheY-like chemotaxis protein